MFYFFGVSDDIILSLKLIICMVNVAYLGYCETSEYMIHGPINKWCYYQLLKLQFIYPVKLKQLILERPPRKYRKKGAKYVK